MLFLMINFLILFRKKKKAILPSMKAYEVIIPQKAEEDLDAKIFYYFSLDT